MKTNINVYLVKKIKPETKWASHDQTCLLVISKVELVYVAKYWDELWLGVKGQTNLEIAGSLRNLFR